MAGKYIGCKEFRNTGKLLRSLYGNVAALESRAADGIANYANVHELSNPDNAFHLYRRVLEAKTCMEEMQRRPGYFIGLPAGLLASYLETSNEWPNLPVECLFFANAKIS